MGVSNGRYLHWICQFFRVDRFTTIPFAQLAPGTGRAEYHVIGPHYSPDAIPRT